MTGKAQARLSSVVGKDITNSTDIFLMLKKNEALPIHLLTWSVCQTVRCHVWHVESPRGRAGFQENMAPPHVCLWHITTRNLQQCSVYGVFQLCCQVLMKTTLTKWKSDSKKIPAKKQDSK